MYRVLDVTTNGKVQVTEGAKLAMPPDAPVSVRWVDLAHQDNETLSVLEQHFAFHPLTLEDCLHFDQRPKLEAYEEYLFLVIQGFRIDWSDLDRSDALELHLFLGKNYVVTVHDHPIPALDAVWSRVQRDGRLAHLGADHLCYLIADALIDSYFPLVDELEVKLDQLEDLVLDRSHEVALGDILDFKRLLVELRKIASPQRDVLALLSRRGEEYVSDRVAVYFRDVHDHALRLYESIESARELLANVRDAHLWSASQRTNEIMKQLTILSAIFLPLTFVTGFFGQNFDGLPYHNTGFMFGMLACCVLLPAAMITYFVRSKWF